MKVVFDGEGKKLKAVLAEVGERSKRDREEKRRLQAMRERGEFGPASLHMNAPAGGMPEAQLNGHAAAGPSRPPLRRQPPPSLVRARRAIAIYSENVSSSPAPPLHPSLPPNPLTHTANAATSLNLKSSYNVTNISSPRSSSTTPLHPLPARPVTTYPYSRTFSHSRPHVQQLALAATTTDSTPRVSRSPSPEVHGRSRAKKSDEQIKQERESERLSVVRELARNGKDHVWIDSGQLSGGRCHRGGRQTLFQQLKVRR